MKKFLALVLTLCMAAGVLPALAETAPDPAGSGLADLLAGLTEYKDKAEGEISKLLRMIAALKEKFPIGGGKAQEILTALSGQVKDLLGSGEEGLGAVLSGLGEQVMGQLEGSGVDVSGMLKGLLGSGEDDYALTEEDREELSRLYDEMNEQALAETGDGVPGKKAAGSAEEFYGTWTCVRFVVGGEEYDMSDGWEMVLGENTFYYIEDGEMCADDGKLPEVKEMRLENGVLKVLINDLWSVFVLTEDGSLADVGSSMVTYYVRAGA